MPAPSTRIPASPTYTTKQPCPRAAQSPPAERQSRDAGLRLLRQGHDREQVRGGADGDVSEADKIDGGVTMRLYLNVSYTEKDEAKALGARWNEELVLSGDPKNKKASYEDLYGS